MNNVPTTGHAAGAGREERLSAVFATMVLQQTNLALMFLGKMPHPETQERLHEPESARVMIDQLEMIEVKTRGNLAPDEDRLLKQSLMALRMAFVEAVDRPPPAPGPTSTATSSPTPAAAAEPKPAETSESAPAASPTHPDSTPPKESDDSRKKFTKRYE